MDEDEKSGLRVILMLMVIAIVVVVIFWALGYKRPLLYEPMAKTEQD